MSKEQKTNAENYPDFSKVIPPPQPLQNKATIKELEEYNKLAKKFNANLEGVFKEKDIKRVIALYNLMSKKQKKKAEPFPVFKAPPPIDEDATPEEKESYNKKYGVDIYTKKIFK